MLSLLLLLLTASKPIEFIQPKKLVVLPPTRVQVQVRVEPKAENRFLSISWFGIGCGGSWGTDLNGEDEPKFHPVEPIWVEISGGSCLFSAEVKGPGDKVLARTELEVRGPDGDFKDSSRAGSVLAR